MEENQIMTEDAGAINVINECLEVPNELFLHLDDLETYHPTEYKTTLEKIQQFQSNSATSLNQLKDLHSNTDLPIQNLRKGNQIELKSHIFESVVACLSFICFDEGSHKSQQWTNKRLKKLAEEILLVFANKLLPEDIRQKFTTPHHLIQQFLSLQSARLIQHIGERMAPLVTDDKHSNRFSSSENSLGWKKNVTAKHIFKYFILKLEYPYVSSIVDKCIPICLSLIDDYVLEDKATGILLIHHIIRNINSTEVIWYGDLLYKYLDTNMMFHEPIVMSELLPCIMHLLSIMEPSGCAGISIAGTLEKHHLLIKGILKELGRTNGIESKMLYMQSIPELVKRIGIQTVRHFQSLLPTLISCTEWTKNNRSFATSKKMAVKHEELYLMILETIDTIIIQCWPRIASHAQRLSMAVMIIFQDVQLSEQQPVSENNKEKLCHWIKQIQEKLKT